MANQMQAMTVPSCAAHTAVYQHPLLEDPPTVSSLSADDRRLTLQLINTARRVCMECPMFTSCLYDSIVKHDVAGYVAATTARQRQDIRHRLAVVVQPEDLDTLAGVVGRHRPVNHDEVLRLRNANPHESLETIAHRLGCSLSTVKRHLRKARTEPAPVKVRTAPSRMQVLNAFAAVIAPAAPKPTPVKRAAKVSA